MSANLKLTILATAEYYGRQLSETVLKMYADDLADLDPQACVEAYERYRKNPANEKMPLPAQIREIVAPEQYVSAEAQAREIASRIVGAISSCGWNNGSSAQIYIGPVGWQAVQRFGGWTRMCEEVGTGPGKLSPLTLQAQLRDQLEGTLKYGSSAIDHVVRIGERQKQKELESASDVLKRFTLSPPDGGPESDGAA